MNTARPIWDRHASAVEFFNPKPQCNRTMSGVDYVFKMFYDFMVLWCSLFEVSTLSWIWLAPLQGMRHEHLIYANYSDLTTSHKVYMLWFIARNPSKKRVRFQGCESFQLHSDNFKFKIKSRKKSLSIFECSLFQLFTRCSKATLRVWKPATWAMLFCVRLGMRAWSCWARWRHWLWMENSSRFSCLHKTGAVCVWGPCALCWEAPEIDNARILGV